ncbi:hypothetical protein AAC387_Pa03g0527 [Persea americana]
MQEAGRKDPELIGARNKEGETPLFQAALHGKKRAFYALHPKCTIAGKDIKHDIVHCKRTDGSSILRVAIQREYFGLAYQIIYWYPELIKLYNEKGLTALHFLAQNPSAFKSGCHLGPFDDFIYRYTYFSPILVAAKMGIVEMVEEVLKNVPNAVYDVDSHEKNVLMLAAENGQRHVDLFWKMYPHRA